ncbi:MAG TPA: hypothetical protein VEC19_05730 [Usitatibacter sp.]|nr:hypothetical protein [Usitatibacter sp.]
MKPTFFLAVLLASASTSQAAIELQYSAGSGALAYRKVHVAPAEVRFHRDFEATSGLRGLSHRLTPEESQRLARDMGESFRAALADALRARGFELAAAPGADVLQIRPALEDLYINAPDPARAAPSRQYVREAGQALLRAEGNDPSGKRLFVASEQRTTGRTEGLSRANEVSNRFWFDTMFRRYAEDLAAALATTR